jgi:haloalkane dehalogenase
MESYLRPLENINQISLAAMELANLAKNDKRAYDLVIRKNVFINKILPGITLRKLSTTELAYYAAPYQKPSNRKPLLQYLREQPFVNKSSAAIPVIRRYSEWLQNSSLQKLMLYGWPGLITTMDDVKWAEENLSHLTLGDLGNGLHNLPECSPTTIAKQINEWIDYSFK